MFSLAKVFTKNKFMAITLMIGLAVSVLLTASLVLSSIYVSDMIVSATAGKPATQVAAFLYTEDKDPSTLLNDIRELSSGVRGVTDVIPLVLVEKYSLREEFSVVVNATTDEGGEKEVKLNFTPNTEVYLVAYNPDYYAYRYDKIVYVQRFMVAEYPGPRGGVIVRKTYSVYPVGEYNITIGNESFRLVFDLYPFSEKFEELRPLLGYSYRPYVETVLGLLSSGMYRYGNQYIAVVTTTDKLDKIKQALASIADVSPGLPIDPGNFRYRYDRYKFDSTKLSEIMGSIYSSASAAIGYYIVILKYDPLKVYYAYDIGAAIKNLGTQVYRLTTDAASKGYGVVIVADNIIENLNSLSGMDMFFKFAALMNMIPGMIVLWLISYRLPPVIISIMRKTIALMRIRGISISSIKRGFIVAVILWFLAGLAIGFVLGPFYAVVISGKPLELTAMYITQMTDVYSLTALAVFAVLALAVSLNKSFKLLSTISPREFTYPSIYTEMHYIGRGMGALGWISLILGIYYVVKTAVGFSPFLYASEHPPESFIVIILLIIAAMLEPVVSFLGPIMFVYSVSKLIVAYPNKLYKMISKSVSPIAGELKHLVSSLLQVKRARMALAIMMIGFSIGFLLSGVLGSISVSHTIDKMKAVAVGTKYYVYKSGPLSQMIANQTIIEEQKGKLLGDSEYAEIIAVYPTNYDIYIKMPSLTTLYNIFFIDTEAYSKLVRIPDAISESGEASRIFSEIKGYNGVIVADPNMRLEGSITGAHDIVIMNFTEEHKIARVTVMDRFYSIPGLLPLKDIVLQLHTLEYTEVTIGGPGGITIPSSSLPLSVVLGIDSYDSFCDTFTKEYNASLVTAYYIYATNNPVNTTLAEKYGWKVYNATVVEVQIDSMKRLIGLGFSYQSSSGIALYTMSLAAIVLLVYASIYENLYSYTLLRARGIESKVIMRIAVGEGLFLSIFGLIPGLLLGIVLGLLSPKTTMGILPMPYSENIAKIYGLTFELPLVPSVFLAVTIVPAVIVGVSLLVSYITYRRVLREAIMLLGSHM